MDKMLNENEKILNEKLKYVCLVGGFSQSRYLQHKLKQKYESKYKFIIPERPILSVIEGAAQLSRIPSFITSRIIKYTYGVRYNISIEKAQSHGIDEDYINKHKYINDIQNKEYVGNCFDVFVKKGEAVKVGQSYAKSSKSDKNSVTRIYRSKETDLAVIIKECEYLGKIEVPYPKDFDDIEDRSFTRFYFGESMIRVTKTMKGKEY
ncbi:hypothetical protein RFI_34382, partial [Reticulomyxa filosa]